MAEQEQPDMSDEDPGPFGEPPYRCADCGRQMPYVEAAEGDDVLCHPDEVYLPDCYVLRTFTRAQLSLLGEAFDELIEDRS